MTQMALPTDLTTLLRELVQICIALSSEPDLSTLIERILAEARRFTRAEAGTLFLREGDTLRFKRCGERRAGAPGGRARDAAAARCGAAEAVRAQPRRLRREDGTLVNVPDAYALPPGQPYAF